MNKKRRNFILMRIIDHPDARDSMNKSVAEICKEENIYLEQVFYVLHSFILHSFDAFFTNKSAFR